MKIPFKPGWTAWWWCEGTSSAVGRKREEGERRGGGRGDNMGGGGSQDLVQFDVGEHCTALLAEQDEAKVRQRQENCERKRKKETRWESCLVTVLNLHHPLKSRI